MTGSIRLVRLAAGVALGFGLAAAAAQAPADQPAAAPAEVPAPTFVLPLTSAALLEQVTRELLGIRYRFGGNDPQRGVDCSGLVRAIWQRLGLPELPRTSVAMAALGQPVALDSLLPGDLLFFNTRGPRYSHVGVYLGDGRFVHASSRQRMVVESRVDERYYRQRFNGARRLLWTSPSDPAATNQQ